MEKLALTINGTQIQGAGGVPASGFSSLEKIIQVSIGYLYIAAVILSLFFLIWGGFSYVTSGGDKQKLQSARQKIFFAIIGLVIAFLAFFIISLIGNFFGVNLLSLPAGIGGGPGALPEPSSGRIGGK